MCCGKQNAKASGLDWSQEREIVGRMCKKRSFGGESKGIFTLLCLCSYVQGINASCWKGSGKMTLDTLRGHSKAVLALVQRKKKSCCCSFVLHPKKKGCVGRSTGNWRRRQEDSSVVCCEAALHHDAARSREKRGVASTGVGWKVEKKGDVVVCILSKSSVSNSVGGWLVSGGAEGAVRVWELARGKSVRALEQRGVAAVDAVGSSAGLRVAAAGCDGKNTCSHVGFSQESLLSGLVRLWELESGALASSFACSAPVLSIRCDGPNRLLWGCQVAEFPCRL